MIGGMELWLVSSGHLSHLHKVAGYDTADNYLPAEFPREKQRSPAEPRMTVSQWKL